MLKKRYIPRRVNWHSDTGSPLLAWLTFLLGAWLWFYAAGEVFTELLPTTFGLWSKIYIGLLVFYHLDKEWRRWGYQRARLPWYLDLPGAPRAPQSLYMMTAWWGLLIVLMMLQMWPERFHVTMRIQPICFAVLFIETGFDLVAGWLISRKELFDREFRLRLYDLYLAGEKNNPEGVSIAKVWQEIRITGRQIQLPPFRERWWRVRLEEKVLQKAAHSDGVRAPDLCQFNPPLRLNNAEWILKTMEARGLLESREFNKQRIYRKAENPR